MGIFSKPDTPSAPPPPPPLPPAAPPPTIADGSVQAAGQNAKAKAAVAAGKNGSNGTNLTGGKGTGAGPTAKALALGDTAL